MRLSTKTLLTSFSNTLVSVIPLQQVSFLCLLDISEAFDTIDHNITLQRTVYPWLGLTETALFWIQSVGSLSSLYYLNIGNLIPLSSPLSSSSSSSSSLRICYAPLSNVQASK